MASNSVWIIKEIYDAYGDNWGTIIGVYNNGDRANFELAKLIYEQKKYGRSEYSYELEQHEIKTGLEYG